MFSEIPLSHFFNKANATMASEAVTLELWLPVQLSFMVHESNLKMFQTLLPPPPPLLFVNATAPSQQGEWLKTHLTVSMHHAPACPSDSPPWAGNKTQCDTWGMTRVEFPLRCRWTQRFIKKNEQVSRSAVVRRETWAGGERTGGGEAEKRRRAVQSVRFDPYGQPVGWWASIRVSVIPSFTTHDRKNHHTHTTWLYALWKGRCERCRVCVCEALERCTRCPLSTPVAIVTNMLRYHGRGREAKWQTQKPDTETWLRRPRGGGPDASAWQVTQVNTSRHSGPRPFHNIWKGPNRSQTQSLASYLQYRSRSPLKLSAKKRISSNGAAGRSGRLPITRFDLFPLPNPGSLLGHWSCRKVLGCVRRGHWEGNGRRKIQANTQLTSLLKIYPDKRGSVLDYSNRKD